MELKEAELGNASELEFMVSYPTIILHSTIDGQELRCYVEVDDSSSPA
jgi:hypothetical protein